MQIIIHRKANIALRSLDKIEQQKIKKALSEFELISPTDFRSYPKIHKLISASGENLFVLRGSQKFRLILSVDADTCTVLDVLDHDRLDRLLPQKGQL